MTSRFVVPVIFCALVCGTVLSCKNTERKDAALPEMDTASLYKKDGVMKFLQEHPGGEKESGAFFSQGVDAYRNKKDVNTAYGLFVKSVSTHPTARAYYELGNVSMELKQYDRAIASYEIAEQLGYEPVSKLLYNIACAYSLSEKFYESATYLEFAIEAGYSNLKQMMEDPDLKNVRESGMFVDAYQRAMSGTSDPELTLWQSYKREFNTPAMPLVLDMSTKVDEKKSISFEFEKFVSEMRTEKFSRDVGKEFFYYAVVEDNANYTAVLYAIKNAILSEDAPYCFVLISYDGKGTLIDKKRVGGQLEVAEPYLACTIKANLHFSVKQFKNTYQKDPEQHGYKDNPVVKSELVSTDYYKIDEKGKFVQSQQELSMR